MTAAEAFKEKKFIKIEQLLTKELVDFFYYNLILHYNRFTWILEHKPYPFDKHGLYNHEGYLRRAFDKSDTTDAFSQYADSAFDALLGLKTDYLSGVLELKLVPTYSFAMMYVEGQGLEKHTDRPSCEISVSVHLGSPGLKPWPLYVEGIPVELNPGDAVVYRGIDVPHWRLPLEECNHYAQCFLHYNDSEGPFKSTNIYDNRPLLGFKNLFNDTPEGRKRVGANEEDD